MMAHTTYLFVLTQIHHDLAALCDNFKHSPSLTINHQMHITYGFSGSNSVQKKKKKNLTIQLWPNGKFPLSQPYCDSSGLECVDICLQELNAYFAILSDVEETLSESQFFPDMTRVSQFS